MWKRGKNGRVLTYSRQETLVASVRAVGMETERSRRTWG